MDETETVTLSLKDNKFADDDVQTNGSLSVATTSSVCTIFFESLASTSPMLGEALEAEGGFMKGLDQIDGFPLRFLDYDEGQPRSETLVKTISPSAGFRMRSTLGFLNPPGTPRARERVSPGVPSTRRRDSRLF